MNDFFKIRPTTEEDVFQMVLECGGKRAHPDADKRRKQGADFVLGNAIIELKLLDEEGLEKEQRQQKIAELFSSEFPDLPVIAIDRARLSEQGRRCYDRSLEGPIKGHISKANKQLKISQKEICASFCKILLILNNGYTSLSHDDFKNIIIKRVINDCSNIDAVIIGGSYFLGDGFDAQATWPLEIIYINSDVQFDSFEKLNSAWGKYAETIMTKAIFGDWGNVDTKEIISDTCFDYGGKTFVKPSPTMGHQSDFYIKGRPRINTSGTAVCPPVATTFPLLNKSNLEALQKHFGPYPFGETLSDWKQTQSEAEGEASELVPLVPIGFSYSKWSEWEQTASDKSFQSVFDFVNTDFHNKIRRIIQDSTELPKNIEISGRYIIVITHVIGQDKANDYSSIFLVQTSISTEIKQQMLVKNQRIFQEHAISLGAAYAIKHNAHAVYWKQDLSYAWL